MSLVTPGKIQTLQQKLYLKVKRDLLAHALRQNLVREPDAGNPHVRFDERGWEREQGATIEAPASESAGNR